MRDRSHSVRVDNLGGERGNLIGCQECGISSGSSWTRWRGYRTDNPLAGEPPALVFYCPACATREFGHRRAHVERS